MYGKLEAASRSIKEIFGYLRITNTSTPTRNTVGSTLLHAFTLEAALVALDALKIVAVTVVIVPKVGLLVAVINVVGKVLFLMLEPQCNPSDLAGKPIMVDQDKTVSDCIFLVVLASVSVTTCLA